MNIAIIGYGIVGSGVSEIIRENAQCIEHKACEQITVKKILDIRDFTDSPDSSLFTKNPEEIFCDPEISVVVETIGGIGVAYEYTKRALGAKKHVVTSNKELVATHGPELIELAAANQVSYLFEASVGGGIPIIHSLNQCLAANRISGVTGILNGTTNYILTQMQREGRDFNDALEGAQRKGYAESNPSDDIEGIDACRKISILSSIAYNEFVDCTDVYTEGISKISPVDIQYAEAMHSTIKLIAISKREGNRVFARVSPAIISMNHPLANVNDVFNAIVVKGDAVGETMFYGKGAGKLPTASAVVGDVVDIAKNKGSCRSLWDRKGYNNILPVGDSKTRYFVRVSIRNSVEAVKCVERIFDSIEFVKPGANELAGEIAFTTSKQSEQQLSGWVKELNESAPVKGIINIIRIEEE
jgi:homoserine dehydrogenase